MEQIEPDAGPGVAILICEDWPHSDELARHLGDTEQDARVHKVAGLCKHPGRIERAVAGEKVTRLVLALCSTDFSLGEAQTAARKTGLDPLGMEILDLESANGDAGRGALLARARVARSEAFDGSTPEHSKAYLSKSVSRRSLLKLALPEYRAAPSVDRQMCVAAFGCRSCADSCPSGALQWAEGRLFYNKSTCQPCGKCVTACPVGAVLNPAVTPAQVEAEIRALVNISSDRDGLLGIAFSCQDAPLENLGPNWYPVVLPCAAMVTPGWMLAPLVMGAAAVSILPGPNCAEGTEENFAYAGELVGAMDQGQGAALGGRLVPAAQTSGPVAAPPPPAAGGQTIEEPFGPGGTARVVLAFANQHGAPADLYFEDARSPLGVIAIESDTCTACGACAFRCPTNALVFDEQSDHTELTFSAALCTACGNCVSSCPEEGAISLAKAVSLHDLEAGRRVLQRAESAVCANCGGSIAPASMLRRLGKMLGNEHDGTLKVISKYCMDCRSWATPQV